MTKRIMKFNFADNLMSGGKAHVALVDKAANLQEVLVMKAVEKQVTVTLSMQAFLMKFMGMWYDDAKALAILLGYDDTSDLNEDWDQHIIDQVESVTLLKGKAIPTQLPESLVAKVEELQKSLGNNLETSSFGEDIKKSDKEESIEMTTKKVEKKVEDIVKAEDGVATIAVTELADLRKAASDMAALKVQVEDMKKAAEAKVRTETTDVVKAFGLFKDEDVETVTEFIVKSTGIEGQGLILLALEDARKAIKQFGEAEHGSDVEAKDTAKSTDEEVHSVVADIIKSQKAEA